MHRYNQISSSLFPPPPFFFFRYFRLTPRKLVFITFALFLTVALWQWQWLTLVDSSPPLRFKRGTPSPLVSATTIHRAQRSTPGLCSGVMDGQGVNRTRLEQRRAARGEPPPEATEDTRERLRGLVGDCAELKRLHGYHGWPVTPQERRFPLAFTFKLHHAPEMFERLLRVVWRPHNLHVVHVDSKAPADVFRLVSDLAACFDNVVLTGARLGVVYASILSLLADVEGVKVALRSPVPWRYHLSLSGQEFPLKTNLEMVQILSLLDGANDIENYPPTHVFVRSLSYKSSISHGTNFITQVKRQPFQHGQVVVRKGSAYNSMSRQFLRWALEDTVNQDLLLWLNDTWAPDEIFWATIGYRPEAPGGVRADIRHDAGTHLSR